MGKPDGSQHQASGDVMHGRIRELWADGLAPATVSHAQFQDLVPASTLRLLADPGIPSDCPLDVTLYPDQRLLQSVPSAAGTTYLMVGDDFGTTLGITPAVGELWSFEPDEDAPARFVNSSLDAFVLFLGLYEKNGNTASLGDRERAAAVERLSREMASYDPAALEDEEAWWSIILEQRVDGLL